MTVFTLSTWVLPVLLAVTLHEAAHGYVAALCGDRTAQEQGRLSLNPLRHIDPFGTIILPALLLLLSPFTFGWAKPVPVSPWRLRNPRYDMVKVALAGPASNLLMAAAGAVSLGMVIGMQGGILQEWLVRTSVNMVMFNLLLAVFNMIPLPPLDGGRVMVGLLPQSLGRQLARLERAGLFVMIGLVVILPMVGRQLGYDLDPVGSLMRTVVPVLTRGLLSLLG